MWNAKNFYNNNNKEENVVKSKIDQVNIKKTQEVFPEGFTSDIRDIRDERVQKDILRRNTSLTKKKLKNAKDLNKTLVDFIDRGGDDDI
jgi:hypothetical protein